MQLYLTDKVASIVRPVKELKGFEKISIEPGASKNVRFTLTKEELGFYNHNYDWVVEPGQFKIFVGTNSQDGLAGDFELIK